MFRPNNPPRHIIQKNLDNQRARNAEREARSSGSSNITDPAPWLTDYFGGGQTAAGVRVNTATALGVPAMAACVGLLSDMLATVPILLVKPNAQGEEVVKNHPAAIAMARPGDLHTSFEMRKMMMTGVGFGGNGYARVHRSANGDPGELEWLSPCDVNPERLPGNRFITYYVSGYYSGTEILSRYDLIHVKGMSCDGIRGISPVAQLRESIGISISQRTAAGAMMSNGAKFAGFLQMLPSAKPEQLADTRAEWKKHQEGALNAGRTPVLWGAEFKSVTGMTARDAEFLESRAFELREIARLYRIPSFLIGDTDKATSFGTGIEEQNLAFRTYCLGPWLNNWEESLGYTLLTTDELRAGYRFEFDREALHAFTISAMASFVSQMRTAAVFSPNDALTWLGYPKNKNTAMDNPFAPLNSSASGAGAPQEKANPKLQPANV